MLSITAASLSRKDVQIADAENKIASMAKIIDSLTDSNGQLLDRLDHMEAVTSGTLNDDEGESTGPLIRSAMRQSAPYEHIDTLMAQDDDKMDRTNRMLLEAMFGMARMVESSAIQLSKDLMDSLEMQYDGSMLQTLAEMVSRRVYGLCLIHC